MAAFRTGAAVLVMLAIAACGAAPAWSFDDQVYVGGEGSSQIGLYDLGPQGLLSPFGSPAGEAGFPLIGLAVSPDGRSLYATSFEAAEVAEFGIGAGGVLTARSPAALASGEHATSVAVSPDSRSVYVTDNGSDAVSEYSVNAEGVLTPMSPATVPTGPYPRGIIVSPDGRSVYVADSGAEEISQYTVGAGGVLEAKSPATVASAAGPEGLVASPDGRYVYAAARAGRAVSQYTVGAGGALEPMSPPSVSTGSETLPEPIVISPDGKSVYTGEITTSLTGEISQFTVGAGGALEPKSPPAVPAGDSAVSLAITPDGKSLYAANLRTESEGEAILQYTIGTGGVLEPKSPAVVAGPLALWAVAVAPDSGPRASFTAAAQAPGSPTSFNASGSSDEDGAITRYDWSFGDGSSASDAGADPAHVYARSGTYTVTLTATDEAGCSSALVFTGQSAYCSADPAATMTRTVTVPAPAVAKPAYPEFALLTHSPRPLINSRLLRLRATCGPAACSLDARASVRLAGHRGRLSLEPASVTLRAGATGELELGIPRALRRAVRAYLRRHPAYRVEIDVAVTVVSAAGVRKTVNAELPIWTYPDFR